MNKYIRWIILFPGCFLIYHVFSQGYPIMANSHPTGQAFEVLAHAGLLSEFKQYRNIIYAMYMVIVICIGIQTTLSTDIKNIKDNTVSHAPNGTRLLQDCLSGIILTTFAYAIASMLLDILF